MGMKRKNLSEEDLIKGFHEAMRSERSPFGRNLRMAFGDRRKGPGKISQAAIEKLHKQNMEFNKKATTKSEGSSIYTHDQGLHDRLDRIFPSSDAGARTAMMKQFKLDGAGAAGGTTVVSAPVVTNAPSTSTVNLTATDIIDRRVVGF